MAFPRNKIFKGHSLPYGTLADASYELRQCYYCLGYKNDHDMPELPCPLMDVEELATPEDVLESRNIAELLHAALDTLPPRQAKILQLRFGIGVQTDHTLEEIGRIFDVTRERIRQIEIKALRDLRRPSRSSDLRMALGLDKQTRIKTKKAQRDAHA